MIYNVTPFQIYIGNFKLDSDKHEIQFSNIIWFHLT